MPPSQNVIENVVVGSTSRVVVGASQGMDFYYATFTRQVRAHPVRRYRGSVSLGYGRPSFRSVRSEFASARRDPFPNHLHAPTDEFDPVPIGVASLAQVCSPRAVIFANLTRWYTGSRRTRSPDGETGGH